MNRAEITKAQKTLLVVVLEIGSLIEYLKREVGDYDATVIRYNKLVEEEQKHVLQLENEKLVQDNY